jgi:hypothetical protein
MQITTQHDCGFELILVRIGAAKAVAYRYGADVAVIGSDEVVRDEIKKVLEMT